MTDVIRAPWTPEQVEQLNRYQYLGLMHPFTCPRHSQFPPLVATEAGWFCPNGTCDYIQDWAHPFMVDQEWMDRRDALFPRRPNGTAGTP